MSAVIRLHAYWRSSASYRVRCALNLKGLDHAIVPVNIVKNGGEQHSADYRALNPQGLVPALIDGDRVLTQSLVILRYLEDRYPQPSLLPPAARDQDAMWSFCQYIASEIQPLHNLRLLNYLADPLGVGEDARSTWIRHWIGTGLRTLEAMLAARDDASAYCYGESPSFADCCLVPQMFAADRFGVDLSATPRLVAITSRLRALPAFAAAHPDRQPDAPQPA